MSIAPFAPGHAGRQHPSVSATPEKATTGTALGFLAELVAAVGGANPLLALTQQAAAADPAVPSPLAGTPTSGTTASTGATGATPATPGVVTAGAAWPLAAAPVTATVPAPSSAAGDLPGEVPGAMGDVPGDVPAAAATAFGATASKLVGDVPATLTGPLSTAELPGSPSAGRRGASGQPTTRIAAAAPQTPATAASTPLAAVAGPLARLAGPHAPAASAHRATLEAASGSVATPAPLGTDPTASLPPSAADASTLAPVLVGSAAGLAPVTTAGDDQRTTAVLRQVFPEITKVAASGNGSHRLAITLHPDDLGEVRVTVVVRGDSVRVDVATDPVNGVARSALEHGAPELRRLLAATGADAQVTMRDLGSSLGSATDGRQGQPGGQPGDQPGGQPSSQSGNQPGGQQSPAYSRDDRARSDRPHQPETTPAPVGAPTRIGADGVDQLI